MSRLLDLKQGGRFPFSYTPADGTDIAKTFARARKRMAEEAERKRVAEVERGAKVRKIGKGAA